MFSRILCLILCVSFLNGYEGTMINSLMNNADQNEHLTDMTEETGETLVNIQEDIQSVLQLQSLVYSVVGEMRREIKEDQEELLKEFQQKRLKIVENNSSRANTNFSSITAAAAVVAITTPINSSTILI